jgi:transposase-like protein
MKTLTFNKEQIKDILQEVACQEDGFNQLMQLTLEALMRSERDIHNKQHGDVSNGFRKRRCYGSGKLLELRVPRSRYEQFYPVILSILKDQEAEARQLAYLLYKQGSTSEQVGTLFEELYGYHYSKGRISQMMDDARQEVRAWLERPLDRYYPLIYIDATFVPTRRGDSVTKEAYYTVLGVRSDRRREVLSVVNHPQESAQGWQEVFEELKQRGVEEIGLVISDHRRGIEEAVSAVYSGTPHQLCVNHLSRNVTKEVRKQDKAVITEDFKNVFEKGKPGDNPQAGWQRWVEFCQKWQDKYSRFKKMQDKARYFNYFTYLNYHPRIQSMIYTTNWVERLNRDYKRVLKMRGALPNSEAVILLMGGVAMDKEAYQRKIPELDYEQDKLKWQ